MSAHAWALASRPSRRAFTAGISFCFTPSTAVTFIVVGNESFDDCDMLTSSLGCTGVLLPSGWPAIWEQRLAITSFTFMLNWVPLPVIQTWSGNMSRCWPAWISSHTCTIRFFCGSARRPAALFTRAAAFLTIA